MSDLALDYLVATNEVVQELNDAPHALTIDGGMLGYNVPCIECYPDGQLAAGYTGSCRLCLMCDGTRQLFVGVVDVQDGLHRRAAPCQPAESDPTD